MPMLWAMTGSGAVSAPPATLPAPRFVRTRGASAAALIVVASLLLPVGLATAWIRGQVFDTNAFVGTVGHLAHDPAVQREVSDKISTALIRQLDLGSKVAVRRTTAAVVASARFQKLWETSVRAAQLNARRIVKGEPTLGVATRRGRVVVNLDPVVDAVVGQLPGPIAALVPPITTNDDIMLFRSSELSSAQPFVRALDDEWWAVPLLCIALFAAAVAIASRRRRAAVWIGAGIVTASTLTFVALLVGRARLLDGLDAGISSAAARAIVDTLLDSLRSELWVALGVGVALAGGALIVGMLAPTLPIGMRSEHPVPGSPSFRFPSTEPTIAERTTMPTPDRTADQSAEVIRQTTGTRRTPL